MKTILAAMAGAILLVPAVPANAGRDEVQWQQHWKVVDAKRKQQTQQASETAVAGRPGDAKAAKEGKPACQGIGRWHPKGAYNC